MENTPSVTIMALRYRWRCSLQQVSGVRDIVVTERSTSACAQLAAGPQAGVRKRIDQEQVSRPDQRRDDAGIGEIAGAENACVLGALEAREPALQLREQRMVAGDQPRGAGADAIGPDRRNRCRLDLRMMGQVEIVVAGERNSRRPWRVTADAVRRATVSRSPGAGYGARSSSQLGGLRNRRATGMARARRNFRCRSMAVGQV